MQVSVSRAYVEEKEASMNEHSRFMQPLIPGFLLHFSIPVSYLKHLQMELQRLVLMTEDEPQRHWAVKVIGGRHFEDGWKDFCDYHQLQVGDFLVFKHESHLVFQVSIYDPFTACQRHSSSSHGLAHNVNCKGLNTTAGHNFSGKRKIMMNEGQPEVATGTPSEQAQFLSCCVTITASSIKHSKVHIPRGFLRSSDLENKCCYVKLMNEVATTWHVKLAYTSDGDGYITGWKDFQIGNNIRPGSVITFQLIEAGRNPTLRCSVENKKVSTFDPLSALQHHLSTTKSLDTKANRKGQVELLVLNPSEIKKETEGHAQDATKIPFEQAQCLSCYITITRHHLNKTLCLPLQFTRASGIGKTSRFVTVIDEKEIHWEVKLSWRKTDGLAFLGQGWKKFLETNNSIKTGSIVRFQLIKAEEIPILKCNVCDPVDECKQNQEAI